MKTQRVEALEVVAEDLRDARSYYDSWRSDGSAYFQKQFRELLAWIEWNPELFPKKYRHFRRAIIRNTYFGVYFVIEPEVTTIVAVADLRRNPAALRRMMGVRRGS